MTQRKILLICGSHRTGTSALTGTLQHLGWQLPKTLMPGSRWNRKGYFESTVIRDFHDKILDYLERPVYDFRETPADIDFQTLIQAHSARMTALLQSEFGRSEHIIIKDPRLCRLLPLWRAYAEAEDQQIHVILPMRPPDEATASLYRRNGFSVSEGLLIWMREVALAEVQSRGMSRGGVLYADLLADWKATLAAVMAQLELENPGPKLAKASEIEDFLSPELRAAQKPAPRDAADAWLHDLAQGIFAAIGQVQGADSTTLDTSFAVLDTATRLLGEASQPGYRAHRAISAIGPAMEVILQQLSRAAAAVPDAEPVATVDIKALQTRLEAAENDLSQARARTLDLEELSSRLVPENQDLTASLQDRFAEIADMVAHLEQAAAEKDDLAARLKKTEKGYKDLRGKYATEKADAAKLKARLDALERKGSAAKGK